MNNDIASQYIVTCHFFLSWSTWLLLSCICMGQTGPVPRAGSTVLPPLQRIKTGPQSPEHVLQFCPLFRESSQDHSPQSMFYSSAPFSENQDRTTVPRACPTVLPPLQRNQTGPQSPEHVLQFCPLFRESKTQQWLPEATRQEQLWGNMRTLPKTRTFTQTIRLTIWGRTKLKCRVCWCFETSQPIGLSNAEGKKVLS